MAHIRTQHVTDTKQNTDTQNTMGFMHSTKTNYSWLDRMDLHGVEAICICG